MAVALPLPARVASSRRALLLLPALGLVVAVLLVAGALAFVTRPTPKLRPSLVGFGGAPTEVGLQRVEPPKPVAKPAPAEPTFPIDVPRDSYAPEVVQEIGSIEIPKLGLRHRMMRGVTLRNIDKGPSHWPGSAWPGQVGNAVVAGHRVTHSKPFRNVDQLVPGDQIAVTARGVRATYVVERSWIVLPHQTEIVAPTKDAVLTIFACHPPGSAKQRYVVRARLAQVAPAA